MFQEFRKSLGENPVGNNAEITKALSGRQPETSSPATAQGIELNEDGEMCDG
jgi:hypothetical protein